MDCAGFVEQQDLGLLGERAGYRDTLPFAARKRVEGTPGQRQRVGGAHRRLRGLQVDPALQSEPLQMGRAAHEHHLDDGVGKSEERLRSDDRDLAGESGAGGPRRIDAAHPHPPAVGSDEAGEQPYERGLARAVGTDHRQHLGGGDVQIHAREPAASRPVVVVHAGERRDRRPRVFGGAHNDSLRATRRRSR